MDQIWQCIHVLCYVGLGFIGFLLLGVVLGVFAVCVGYGWERGIYFARMTNAAEIISRENRKDKNGKKIR